MKTALSSLGRRMECETKDGLEIKMSDNSIKAEQKNVNIESTETKLFDQKNNSLFNRRSRFGQYASSLSEPCSSTELLKDFHEKSRNSYVNSDFVSKKNSPKKVFEMIDRTLNTLLNKIVPGSKKKKEKLILLHCVELLVNETFGNSAKLFLTGSAAAEIDSEMSDVDLVVFTPLDSRVALMKIANQFKNIRRKHKDDCIKCKILRQNGYQQTKFSRDLNSECLESHLCNMEVNVITTAKVPVMMMKNKQTRFKTECDISINMYTSLLHSILFQSVLNSYPELQSVLRLIKYWLHIRRLPVARDGGLPCIVWLLLAIVHCSVNGNRSSKSQKEHLESICRPAKQMLSNLQVRSNCTSFQSTEIGSPLNMLQNDFSNINEDCEFDSKAEESEPGNILEFSAFNVDNQNQILKLEKPQIYSNSISDFDFSFINYSESNHKTDFSEKGTTFMALVSFFTSIWNRSSLTCSVSVINKNVQPKDLKTASQIIFNNGGIWDEVLTLDDPSASLLRQLEILKYDIDDFGFRQKLFTHIFPSENISRHEDQSIGKIEDSDRKQDLSSNLNWTLPSSDCMIVSNLAARITCGTWLVYLYELKRGHDILDTYLQQISISVNEFNENEIVNRLFKPINEEIYKIPAKLSSKTPICVYPFIDLDLIIEKDLIALVQVPYFESNHKFCLILLFGHLVILRIEKICVDWEGGWWSKEFLSRRDVRSVLHGSLFAPIPLSFSHLENGGSTYCILQPLDSRIINYFLEVSLDYKGSKEIIIDEIMVNPALFITLLNSVEWYSVDDSNGFYIIPVNEYYRFLDMESIARESPYWYENFIGKSSFLQPLVSSCRFCKKTSFTLGMERVLQFKNLYWTIKRNMIDGEKR